MQPVSPARLHVLLASAAPLGVVIRRGPSKQVATLLWDRSNDSFQLGQWLKGRIYERRSDLSPDGKFLIYFALNGKWQTESKGSWTAISRAPYLKAIEFFPDGETYFGGGLWTSPTTYWLHSDGRRYVYKSQMIRRQEDFCPEVQWGFASPYYARLVRDQWQFRVRNQFAKHAYEMVFEKPLTAGWTLRKRDGDSMDRLPSRGADRQRHELIDPDGNAATEVPDWEWADWDGRRLMWSSQGRLFAAKIRSNGIQEAKELYDFNSMKFEAIEAEE